MTVTDQLLAAQAERFAGLDRALPDLLPPEEGDVITAALPDGRRVAGVVIMSTAAEGTPHSLWSARQTWELFPLVGDTGWAGMEALLRAFRRWLDRLGADLIGADTACIVSWPSRDIEATRAFLDHGLQPLTVIAVRPVTADKPPPLTIDVRKAGPADLDVVTQLAMAELTYSAMVGAAIVRPDAVDIRRAILASRLEYGDDVWLAERDGVVVAMAEATVLPVNSMLKISRQLLAGRWGYVNSLAVLPGARRSGIGQQLMALVHSKLADRGVHGHHLHYNPPNPLSSVFWPRQGYRPLWTQWEVRPADGLR